jgi:membrane protease YdiL (CAAX protease family)
MIRPFWRRSTVLFAVLSLTLVAIKLLLDVALTDLPLRDQAAAFTWTLVLAIIAIGLAGLLTDRASGLLDPLTDWTRDWRGIRLAVITGAIYGLITIGMYVWHPVSSLLNTGSG